MPAGVEQQHAEHGLPVPSSQRRHTLLPAQQLPVLK